MPTTIAVTGVSPSGSITVSGVAGAQQITATGIIAEQGPKGDKGDTGATGMRGGSAYTELANLAAFPATGTTGLIYVAIDTSKTYRWSGSAYMEMGGGLYTNATAVPVAFGGVLAGETFSSTPITTVLDELLYPYQSPAFSSFAISGQAQSVEVGTTISGSKTFTWATSNPSNVTAASVAITGPNALNSTGNASSGSISLAVGTNQLTAPGSATWTITGSNTHSGSFNTTFPVNWYWRVYTGTSTNTTLTESQIEALAGNSLTSTGFGNFSLAAGGYKYFCYPTSMTAASSFTDTSTNFGVAMAESTDDASFSNTANGFSYAIVSVTNAQSQTTNYRVYRSKYILGGAITIGVA